MERSNTDGQPTADARDLMFLTRGRFGTQLSRRDVLKRAVALGLSAPTIAALLAACGGSSDKATATKGATSSTAATGGSTPAAGSGSPAAGTTPASGTTPATGATASTGGGKTGGTLVIGKDLSDLKNFDPAIVYEVSSGPPNEAVYPALLINDPADITKYQPVLCEEVPTVENGGISADLLNYTFKLRKGVKFHTGNEMKAADFVFMVQRAAYSLGPPGYLSDPFVTKDASDNITAVNVKAVDDYTVTYTLAEPNLATLAVLTGNPGVPYDSVFAQTQGAVNTPDASQNNTGLEWFNNNSAGTGPYKLTSWVRNDSVTLEKFADYKPLGGVYAEVGGFDKIVFKHIAGSGQQLQQLQGGGIQMAMELDADAVNSLKSDPAASIAKGQSLNLVYLALNTDPTLGGPLADKKVRQAVAWAMDYDGIIGSLMGGNAIRPAAPVPVGVLGADKVLDKAYHQDVEKAKALLKEANADGAELKLTFGSGQAYSGVANETLAAKVQADLEAVGFKITLDPEDPDQRLTDFRAGNLQFTFSEWSPSLLDVSDYAYLFGGVEGEAPAKRVHYVNADSTALLKAGIKEGDVTKREDDYVKVMENLIEDVPFVPLWQTIFQFGTKGATNVIIQPAWLFLTHLISPA